MFSKCKSAPKLGELENSSKWMEPSSPHNDNWCWTLEHPFIYCDICNLGSLGCTWVLTPDIWHNDIILTLCGNISTLDLCKNSAEWSSNIFGKHEIFFRCSSGCTSTSAARRSGVTRGSATTRRSAATTGSTRCAPDRRQPSHILYYLLNIQIYLSPYHLHLCTEVLSGRYEIGFIIFILPNCYWYIYVYMLCSASLSGNGTVDVECRCCS